MPDPAPNATLTKFGYPDTLLHQGRFWAVLVRPAQPTLGSLVLCAVGDETSYGDLPVEAFIEQGKLVTHIEEVLGSFISYERINYLMLMMVDTNVHFHVLPRYAGERQFAETTFSDQGWPGPPDLASSSPAPKALIEALRQAWHLTTSHEGDL